MCTAHDCTSQTQCSGAVSTAYDCTSQTQYSGAVSTAAGTFQVIMTNYLRKPLKRGKTLSLRSFSPLRRDAVIQQPRSWQTGSEVAEPLEGARATRCRLLPCPLLPLMPQFPSLLTSPGVSGNTIRDTPEAWFSSLLGILRAVKINHHTQTLNWI